MFSGRVFFILFFQFESVWGHATVSTHIALVCLGHLYCLVFCVELSRTFIHVLYTECGYVISSSKEPLAR